MNANTSNSDGGENATGESMKKNIPGLWLLLLDVAVALAGFCTGVHFFWKDQNEGGVVVAAAMSAALAVVPGEVFGPMLGRDKSKKFEACIFLTSMLMSWDAGAAMACANYGGKGTPFSGMGMALWLLSLGLVYCDYAYCGFVLKHANPSSMHLMLAPIPFFVGMGLPGFLYYVDGSMHTFIWLICVVMLWISALSFAYCWPDGKIGSNLAGFTSLLEWRYVISSTLFLKNEITESITFDNIKVWDPASNGIFPNSSGKTTSKPRQRVWCLI